MPDLPPFEEQQRFYDEWNARHRSGGFEDVGDEVRLRAQRVLLELNALGLHDPDILEVGCGTGWFTEKLARLGTTTGVDISPKAIEAAQARLPQCEFVCADFCNVGYPRHGFDVVVCLETLFYVEDPALCVAELSRVLRPGGILLLTTLNKFVFDRRSDLSAPVPGQIRNWLGRRELRSILRQHFHIEKEITIDPRGDRGVLRIVNSYKLNAVLGRMVGSPRLRAMKERAGFGGGVIYVARNP